MKFSKHVLNAISEVDRYSWEQNYEALRILRNAAESVKSESDRKILHILSGVLSLSFTEQEQDFSPLIQLADGRRSFAICDIEESDYGILENVIGISSSLWVRAQVSHILWELTTNHEYGEKAIDFWVQLFNETIDAENWTTCVDAIKPALQISKKLGKNTESFKKVFSAIHNAIIALDGSDPLFLSISLIELVVEDATQAELSQYLRCVNNLAAKNICETLLFCLNDAACAAIEG